MTLSQDLKDSLKRQYELLGSYRKVAKLTGKSASLVRKVVLDLYKKDKATPGPKKKVTPRQGLAIKRKVLTLISQEKQVTAPKLKRLCELNHVSVRTIRREVSAMDMVYAEAKRKVVLTPAHKANRLRMAEEWLTTRLDWGKVVFTDEKKFNSDGPDCWCSWQPRNSPIVCNKRQQGGPSLQVWGMLVPGPHLYVFELPPRGDSQGFVDFIQHTLLPTLLC